MVYPQILSLVAEMKVRGCSGLQDPTLQLAPCMKLKDDCRKKRHGKIDCTKTCDDDFLLVLFLVGFVSSNSVFF